VTATAVANGPAAATVPADPEAVQHWVVPLLVLIVGMFMTVLDTSIVNVAVPTIQTEFGGSSSDIAWISTAYSLVLGVVVPTTAWLGDRVGLARLYVFGLAGFAIASALCGLSWSLPSLIGFRVLQAIPGALLPAITMTMVYRIVPKDKMGAAMGMYGIGVIVAPALGPTLGGYLVEYVNWRIIFYINVPIAVVGVVLALMFLPPFKPHPAYKFDVLGFLTAAGGLVSLLLATSEGESWGWTSYRIVGLFVASAVLLALFVVIELEIEHPLLNLSVFRTWPYTNSLLIIGVQTVGMYSTLFYIPVFVQSAMGLPALQSGLLVLPQALVMAAVAPISGRLYDRFGPRWLVFSGLLIAAFAMHLMTGLNLNTTKGEIIAWTCLRSFGMGLGMMSVTASGIGSLDARLTNSGTALNNVTQRVSAALGLAALSAFLVGQEAQLGSDRGGLLAASDPRIARAGVVTLYQFSKSVSLEEFATALSNTFAITTWVTVLAALLALGLQSGPPNASPKKLERSK
jgi:EmrB/QacA subfamily drug resistance transporter